MVMSYLIIKMLRDIKKYWMQFVSVFFMALISIMIFSGMAAVWNGSDITAENYSKATNLADVWIYTKTTRSEERRVGKECRSRWSPYH